MCVCACVCACPAAHILVVDVREEDAGLLVVVQVEGVLPVLCLYKMLLHKAVSRSVGMWMRSVRGRGCGEM